MVWAAIECKARIICVPTVDEGVQFGIAPKTEGVSNSASEAAEVIISLADGQDKRCIAQLLRLVDPHGFNSNVFIKVSRVCQTARQYFKMLIKTRL